MNLVYGALLLHSAGKAVDEAGMKKITEATGIKVEEAQIKALVAALEGVNIEEAISKAAMPVAAAPVAEAKEEKKEIKKEEDESKRAEEAAAGLGALFG